MQDGVNRNVSSETNVAADMEKKQFPSEVVAVSTLIVSDDLSEETVNESAVESFAPVNVGDFIDPEDVPPSSGERINVGRFIDPDEVPVIIGKAVNVGQFIDPEQTPDGGGERINVGVFKDPEAPSFSLSGPKNVGDYRSPPDP